MCNNYIIAVDENGQPYIAHSWANRWKNYKHKYLEKVQTKSGAWRYLYTPEEVAAFRRERKLNKNRSNVSSQELASAHREANAARERVRRNRKIAGQKVKNTIDKYDGGLNEWNRYRKAKKSGANSAAVQAYEKAYKKTALGKASTLLKRVANTPFSSSTTKVTIKELRGQLRPLNGYNRKRPTSHQKNVTGTAKEGWSKRRESADVSTKAKYGEYNRNDPDFSDANYKRAKNIGDTDFATFKRNDGRWVILEEDMKWVLPKGVSGNSPEIRKAIKKFSDRVESARAINNYAYTHDEWLSAVNEAINDASRKAKNKY